MTVTQLYDQYKIMPSLQQHMLRVAGVAQIICESLTVPVNTDDVIKACLLHDLGNIIKFDLTTFPDFAQPEGLEFWQKVQNVYRAEYGFDEHLATKKIAENLGVSPRVMQLIDATNFDNTRANFETTDLEIKICDYADTRVTPFGVVSLEARLQDLEDRYRAKYPSEADQAKRQEFGGLMKKIEQQIFKVSKIRPDEINDSGLREAGKGYLLKDTLI